MALGLGKYQGDVGHICVSALLRKSTTKLHTMQRLTLINNQLMAVVNGGTTCSMGWRQQDPSLERAWIRS